MRPKYSDKTIAENLAKTLSSISNDNLSIDSSSLHPNSPKLSPKWKRYWDSRKLNKYTGRPFANNENWLSKSDLSPINLKRYNRDLTALDLRMEGYNYEEIANMLGYHDRQHVYKALKKIMNKVDLKVEKKVDDYRSEMAEKYEMLLLAHETKAFNGDSVSSKEYRETLKDLRKMLAIDIEPTKKKTNFNINSKDICKLSFPNGQPIDININDNEN